MIFNNKDFESRLYTHDNRLPVVCGGRFPMKFRSAEGTQPIHS